MSGIFVDVYRTRAFVLAGGSIEPANVGPLAAKLIEVRTHRFLGLQQDKLRGRKVAQRHARPETAVGANIGNQFRGEIAARKIFEKSSDIAVFAIARQFPAQRPKAATCGAPKKWSM